MSVGIGTKGKRIGTTQMCRGTNAWTAQTCCTATVSLTLSRCTGSRTDSATGYCEHPLRLGLQPHWCYTYVEEEKEGAHGHMISRGI